MYRDAHKQTRIIHESGKLNELNVKFYGNKDREKNFFICGKFFD